jgi:uncharacterized protein (DUF1330 family)
MPGYVVVDITRITDAEKYGRYKQAVSPEIDAAGGHYLVRGGAVDVLEGNWRPGRLVIVRFDSVAAARSWWASPAYEPLKQMRQTAAAANMVLVAGLDEEAR